MLFITLTSLTDIALILMKWRLERVNNEIPGKGPPPDIDFTQHQLENGYTIRAKHPRTSRQRGFSFVYPQCIRTIFLTSDAHNYMLGM